MADPVADFLSSPDQFGAPPKRTTLTLPKKGAAATPDNPVDAYLASPDNPPYQPDKGPDDFTSASNLEMPDTGKRALGAFPGIYDNIAGMFSGFGGQVGGLLDIPVHAAAGGIDKLAGTSLQKHVPEPEDVQKYVSDIGQAHPSGEYGRGAQAANEALGDIESIPGHVLSAVEGYLRDPDKAPMGTPTKDGSFPGVGVMQAQTGIAPVVDHSGPQTEYEKGIVEAVGNGLAMVAGAREAAERAGGGGGGGGAPRGTSEPGLEEPPPSKADDEFKSIHGESEYTAGRDAGGVDRAAPAGRQAGSGAPDRSKIGRLLAGSNASLTPFKAEAPPADIQWNSVELEPGLGDVRMPQKNVYASPEDEFVQKLGESQYGHSIRGEKFRVDPQVLQRFRQMGQEGHFPWWQEGGKGMIANIAHAVDIAAERRQVRQKAYRTLADEVGTREMLRNAPDYALTFDWRDSEKARPTEIVCGDL